MIENFCRCPICGKISLTLTESGIGYFKKGGTCSIAKSESCGYQTII